MSEIDLNQHRLANIEKRLDGVEREIGDVKAGLSDVKAGLAEVRSSIRTFAALAGAIFAVTCLLLATLGQSRVRELARQVVREELAYRATTIQQGRFTAANRVADEPPTFEWKLKQPVEPSKVAMLAAEPVNPLLPGVAVTAQLSADGSSCRMVLHGATIQDLPDPIDAKLTIVVMK